MNNLYKSIFFILLLSLCSTGAVFAQHLHQKISQAYAAFEQDPNLRNATMSFTVMDARTGELIFAKNEQVGLATASTMKAITSITAYSVLGADYTYPTTLSYRGEIDAAGTLLGDVIVKGYGDPTLGSSRFSQTQASRLLSRWVGAIKAAGIKKIAGHVVTDDSHFGGVQAPDGWTWVDLGNYYGAGVSAVNWKENTFQVVLESGKKAGDPVRLVSTDPEVPYLTLVNEVVTGLPGSGDQVYGYAAPYSTVVYLRGSYGQGLSKKIGLSLPDGGFALAYALKEALDAQGISSALPVTSAQLARTGEGHSANQQVLDDYESPPLREIMEQFNKKSINLYGEALLMTLAIHQKLRPQTKEVAQWEQEYWTDRLGIPKGELKIKDGSGLSPENRLTTLAMAKILREAKAQPWFTSFYANLPVYNGIRMKSGTISDVLGYVGYHTSSDGTPLVFSVLVNNHHGSAPSMRQKIFKMLNSLK